MPADGSRWRALAVLAFGAAVIGATPILARMTETGAAAAGFWRVFLALPALALMAGRGGAGLGGPHPMAVVAGVMFALDLGFWHYGVRLTSVTNATVLTNLTPVLVTLFGWVVLRQRPHALFLAALAGAVAGAGLMALESRSGPGPNPPLGDLLSAITAVWYGGYFLAIAAGRRTQTAGSLMLWSGIVSAPLLLVAALLLGERIVPAGAAGWAACLGLAAVHVAGQGSIAWAMGRLPAALASVVALVQPVVAAVLGWLLFAEAVTPLQAAGAAVLLLSVVLAQRGARPSVHGAEQVEQQDHRQRDADQP